MKSKISVLSFFLALGLGGLAATAAIANPVQMVEEDRFLMQESIRKYGYAAVMVTLEEYSINEVKSLGTSFIESEMKSKYDSFKSWLGQDFIEAGSWSNGMGQVGFLATEKTIERIKNSGLVRSIQPDGTRSLGVNAWVTQKDSKIIESELEAKGRADIEFIINSDISYTIDSSGKTIYSGSNQDAIAQASSLKSIAQAMGGHLQLIEDRQAIAGASAVVKANIDYVAYHGLRASPYVRAIRKSDSKQGPVWPKDYADVYASNDTVAVELTILGGDTFSPYEGFMSALSWKRQESAHAKVIEDVLGGAGIKIDDSAIRLDGLGSAILNLNESQLGALISRNDSRVKGAFVNRPFMKTALSNSGPLVGAPSAFANGYSGAGQKIVVLDTGIEKNHVFFKNLAGNSRVTSEGCYGSNQSGTINYQGQNVTIQFKSICVNQNSSGDSAYGTLGSGAPYSDPNFCSFQAADCAHGSHVAGIAAGRHNSAIPSPSIQGVAPDAEIISVQIGSYPVDLPPTGGSYPSTVFPLDVGIAALAIVSQTYSGIVNPVTISASLGGGKYSSACNDWSFVFPGAVSQLFSRGIPFVAATGNNAYNDGIWAPACVKEVIKVSSVSNDSLGVGKSNFANVVPPENFPGEYILFAPGGQSGAGANAVRSANYPGALNSTTSMRGTSMATPHVSGFYAVAKSVWPSKGVRDITAWIVSSAGSIPITVPTSVGSRSFRRIKYTP